MHSCLVISEFHAQFISYGFVDFFFGTPNQAEYIMARSSFRQNTRSSPQASGIRFLLND